MSVMPCGFACMGGIEFERGGVSTTPRGRANHAVRQLVLPAVSI
ncbi:MAG: hypothetical protein Q4B17_11450 [Lautropia sp.]|nr:hypothetical protein [Lautropia sp.]